MRWNPLLFLRGRPRLLALLLIVPVAALCARSLVAYYSQDSFHHLAVARGIVDGLGLSGRLMTVDSGSPRPLDLWPPGYLLALSIGLFLGTGPTLSAFLAMPSRSSPSRSSSSSADAPIS